MPAFEPDRKRLNRALATLGGTIEGGPVSAETAVRIELSAEGQINSWEEIFSTESGLSAGLRERTEAFLSVAGMREAGTPLVVVLFFSIQEGRVVSAGSSSYQLACE